MIEKNRAFLFKLFAFFGPFLTYLYTLAPTITLEDSGELITAAHTMGIAHPSGYPLFCFLGKLFTLLPVGNETSIAWKVNLMSAFFAALTCIILYHILIKIRCQPTIALSCTWIAGFSKIFWSQSLITEVYTLHAFFCMVCLYMLILWKKSQKNIFLLVFSFLYGLSLTNHTAMILYAPFFLLFIYLNLNSVHKKKLLLKCSGLVILGLSFYFYIPLRMGAEDILNFGNIQSLKEVFFHITREQYQTLDFAASVHFQEKASFILHFGKSLTEQYGPFVWLLGIIGLSVSFKKQARLSLLILSMILIGSIGIIVIRNLHYTPQNIFLSRVYYINSYLLFVIFIATGCQYLFKRYSLKTSRMALSMVFLIPFLFHFSSNNQRDNRFAYLHATALLNTLPPSAYFLNISSDDFLFPLAYLKMVENKRPDTTLIDTYGAIFRSAFKKELCHPCPKDMIEAFTFKKHVDTFLSSKEARPRIYFQPGNFKKLQFSHFGLFYSKTSDTYSAPDYSTLYGTILNYPISGDHFFENRIQAIYHIRYGEILYSDGHLKDAFHQFNKATHVGKIDHEIYYKIGQFLTSNKEYAKASSYFIQSLNIHPFLSEAHNGLGSIALKQKKYKEAIPHFQNALKTAIYNRGAITFNLGYTYLKQGNIDVAYSLLKKALTLNPQNHYATYHLGHASVKLGFHDEARYLFKDLLEKLPKQSPHLRKLISDLKRLN